MSEIGFTGDMRRRDAGIEAVMFSLLIVPEDGEESFQIGELLQVSEQFEKEEANGIVGMPSHGRVGGGADGPDEGEIDQGSDKTGESAGNLSGGIDLDPSGNKAVIRKEPASRFWKGLLMLEVNGNTDLVEFSNHVP